MSKSIFRYAAAGSLTLVLLLGSCAAPSNISYFQDAAALNQMAVSEIEQFKLRPEDKINIIVNSANPMLENQFTLTSRGNVQQTFGASVPPVTSAGGSGSSNLPIAYTVDDQGTIKFPILGKISVAGKTRKEVAQYIEERLMARDLVEDPIVTVEYVNIGVNVLGEVNKAGRINVTKDHFTVLDAITGAGDLTINGKRENVMVCRQVDGVNQVYYLDLTNMQSLLQSPAYYLQQNDLVYVSPNSKRKREANSVGNTFTTPAIWISIASLLTTITALILK